MPIVEATELTAPDMNSIAYGVGAANFSVSPDGAHLAIVTRTASIRDGTNRYQLIVYGLAEVRRFVNSLQVARPQGRVVAEVTSHEAQLIPYAVREPRWISDDELSYIAEVNDDVAQIFSVNLRNQVVTQLTHSEDPVLTFDYASGTLAYVTLVQRTPAQLGRSFAVGTQGLNQVLYPRDPLLRGPAYQLFLRSRDARTPSAIGTPWDSNDGPPEVWLSPGGDYLISRRPVLDTRRLSAWARRHPLLRTHASNTKEFFSVEVASGTVTSLFDAPDGQNYGGYSVDVAWLSDGRVLIANTFANIDGHAGPLLLEYDTRSKGITWIADLSPVSYEGLQVIGSYAELTTTGGVSCFHLTSRAWNTAPCEDSRVALSSSPHAISLRIAQDANTPPQLAATDTATGASRSFTDLNPHFRTLDFGHVAPFSWSTRDGDQLHGGLLYPPDFVPGRRYPVVVQTYGYRDDIFALDHPRRIWSAFPAQALASREMLVLFLPDSEPQIEVHSASTSSIFEARQRRVRFIESAIFGR